MGIHSMAIQQTLKHGKEVISQLTLGHVRRLAITTRKLDAVAVNLKGHDEVGFDG